MYHTTDKEIVKPDGTIIPVLEHYFRKAVDNFTHDNIPHGNITDPQDFKDSILMQKIQSNEISTKNKVCHNFIKSLSEIDVSP